ncbi:DgyrCDS14362 [Dimorphilus gyrociliatus]|uniref:DgyrCDS14362 n=1 Tax=Dimorphilus gyrociliatus TaxID=2664684 RepID=A0A7I8WDC3_9ANNE|nr:DgyrCDS14362 [Dimorphilus gyrociliatus]
MSRGRSLSTGDLTSLLKQENCKRCFYRKTCEKGVQTDDIECIDKTEGENKLSAEAVDLPEISITISELVSEPISKPEWDEEILNESKESAIVIVCQDDQEAKETDLDTNDIEDDSLLADEKTTFVMNKTEETHTSNQSSNMDNNGSDSNDMDDSLLTVDQTEFDMNMKSFPSKTEEEHATDQFNKVVSECIEKPEDKIQNSKTSSEHQTSERIEEYEYSDIKASLILPDSLDPLYENVKNLKINASTRLIKDLIGFPILDTQINDKNEENSEKTKVRQGELEKTTTEYDKEKIYGQNNTQDSLNKRPGILRKIKNTQEDNEIQIQAKAKPKKKVVFIGIPDETEDETNDETTHRTTNSFLDLKNFEVQCEDSKIMESDIRDFCKDFDYCSEAPTKISTKLTQNFTDVESTMEAWITSFYHKFLNKLKNDRILTDGYINLNIRFDDQSELMVRVHKNEVIGKLRQMMERRSFKKTIGCQFFFEGKRLDESHQIVSVPNLANGSVLNLSLSNFDHYSMRKYLKDFWKMLNSQESIEAYLGVNGRSLCFVHVVLNSDQNIFRPIPFFIPLPVKEGHKLSMFHPNQTNKGNYKFFMSPCLKKFCLSGWNPPPISRKNKGDLFYLSIETLEDRKTQITCCTRGFYINQSTDTEFNPAPETPSLMSNNLIETLSFLSPGFKQCYSVKEEYYGKRHLFEFHSSPQQVYSWLSPKLPIDHRHDFSMWDFPTGHEVIDHTINSQIQSILDKKVSKLHEEIQKEKDLYDLQMKFSSAATKIFSSLIDDREGRVVEGKDGEIIILNGLRIKIVKNDNSYAAANADVRNTRRAGRAKAEKLRFLTKILIDYKGFRAIIEPVIHKKPESYKNNLCFGSVDFGDNVVNCTDADILTDIRQLCRCMGNKSQEIVDCHRKTHSIQLSINTIVTKGDDNRSYMADMTTFFPPDPNFLLNLPSILISPKMKEENFPRAARHQHTYFREYFWKIFRRTRFQIYLKKLDNFVNPLCSKIILEDVKKNALHFEEGNEHEIERLDSFLERAQKLVGDEINFKEEWEKHCLIMQCEGSSENRTFFCSGNPNAFNRDLRIPLMKQREFHRDQFILAKAADFMLTTHISDFIESHVNDYSIIDGFSLTSKLHTFGINIRYMGNITKRLPDGHFLIPIFILEMINRAAKHIFRRFITNVELHHKAAATSHFLNCYLSHQTDSKKSLLEFDCLSMRKVKRRRSHSSTRVSFTENLEWTNATRQSLLAEIKEDMVKSFQFVIPVECQDIAKLIEIHALKKVCFLRAFCKTNGVQVHQRDYEFESENKIFSPEDILMFYPLVKISSTKSNYADCLVGLCRKELGARNWNLAHHYIKYAILINKEIYGPIHIDLSICYRILAMICFLTENFHQAIISQRDALMLIEKVKAHDDPTLAQEFQLAGVFHFAQNMFEESMHSLFRARQIFYLSSPSLRPHPMIGKIDFCLGVIFLQVGDIKRALLHLRTSVRNLQNCGKNTTSKSLICQQMIAYCYLLSLDYENCKIEQERLNKLLRETESFHAWPVFEIENCVNDLQKEQKRRLEVRGNPNMAFTEILEITSGRLRLDRVYMLNLIAFVSDIERREATPLPRFPEKLNLEEWPLKSMYFTERRGP